MKILFLSNYFNHHQSALGDALFACTEGDFRFIACEKMPSERAKLGCSCGSRSYVLPLEGNGDLVDRWLREADAVIAGSAPERLVRRRVRLGKLLFRYRERPLRFGLEPEKYFPRLLRWHWRDPAGKPIYLLCASAYTAGDYAKFGLFRGRAFRWGYFPECRMHGEERLMGQKDPRELLWCGRLVDLKHPEAALEAAGALKDLGYGFHLGILGTGPMEGTLRRQVKERGLEDRVSFLGAKSAGEVRQAMERAGIFLFTSDAREGWGAVVNEAMNSGCAVVASRAAGSVPYLLSAGENGLIYESGNEADLTEKLRFLLDNPNEVNRLGLAGYRTIRDLWNGEEAARRLVRLAEELLAGGDGRELYRDGPCSPA